MKTSPKLILILTALFAAAGFFLRRGQLAKELLSGGFLAQGSYLHIVLLILTAVLVVGLTVLLLPLEKKESWLQVFPPAPLPNSLLLLSSVGLLAGNLLLLLAGGSDLPATAVNVPQMITLLNSLQGPLGILAAGCIAAFSMLCLYKKKPSALLYMSASIYLVVRLIVHFQSWNTDPSVHDYAYQLLAAICAMLGTFQLAGFSFDKGKRRMSLFWCLCSVFFCGITVADSLHSGQAAEILINASLLLFVLTSACQLLFANGEAPVKEENVSPEEPCMEKCDGKSDEKS